jgi:hypothetical protein
VWPDLYISLHMWSLKTGIDFLFRLALLLFNFSQRDPICTLVYVNFENWDRFYKTPFRPKTFHKLKDKISSLNLGKNISFYDILKLNKIIFTNVNFKRFHTIDPRSSNVGKYKPTVGEPLRIILYGAIFFCPKIQLHKHQVTLTSTLHTFCTSDINFLRNISRVRVRWAEWPDELWDKCILT